MIENNQVSGRQIAAARALLGMGQAELASAASISIPTLRRMEASVDTVVGLTNNVKAVLGVLESFGIEFLGADTPGVRLNKHRGPTL